MLEVIKDVNLPADCLGGNDVMALRHVPRFVDLSCVVNLRFDRDTLVLGRSSPCGVDIPSWFHDLVTSVLGRFQGHLDFHDLYVVLLIVARVCSNKQLLARGIRARRPFSMID